MVHPAGRKAERGLPTRDTRSEKSRPFTNGFRLGPVRRDFADVHASETGISPSRVILASLIHCLQATVLRNDVSRQLKKPEEAAAEGLQAQGPGAREQIRAGNPEIIFFCEPKIRDYLNEDPAWKGVRAVREGRIFVYDCGLTCRSGPRIIDMAEALSEAVLRVR